MVLNGSTERLEYDTNIQKVHAPTRDSQTRQLAKEPAIRKTLLLAHHLNQHLALGKIKDLNQASTWLGINQTRLSHILGLLHLAPSIQTEIITADQNALSEIPEYKLRDLSAKADWNRQTILWQELKQAHA